ncbi:MAG TPA: outer membrane protein assembly factor BamD [Polyangiaceae bacterium]|nr:outer membrane protein assembly factor BamD [Polyangiaceae bacterium]
MRPSPRNSSLFARALRRTGARRAIVVCTLPLLLAPMAGCATEKRALSAAEFQRNAEAAYNAALETFYDRDWISVPVVMEEVKKEYAGTRFARLAQLRIADAQFHQGNYAESITAYREFLRDFPNDPEVPYARYRVVLCHFQARGESSMSPPLEERDLVNVRDADEAITSFLKDYPAYPKREDLLYMHLWVRGMLARHELYVARYYLNRDNFEAALSRAEYALRNFRETGLEPEALVLLGETQMRRGERSAAKAAFEQVLNHYPASPFVIPARNFIAEIERDPLGPKTATPTTPHY